MMRCGFADILPILLLVGCAHSAPPDHAPLEPLLAAADLPAWPGPRLALTQVVNGQAEDKSYSARFEVEFDHDRLALVALSHAGAPLFQMQLSDGSLQLRTQLAAGSGLRPAWVLSDIGLAYWPPDILAGVLRRKGLKLVEGADTRIVNDADGQTVVVIRYGGAERLRAAIHLENRRLGYQLDIQTRAIRELR
jgi:hypothetical protein